MMQDDQHSTLSKSGKGIKIPVRSTSNRNMNGRNSESRRINEKSN